MQITIARPGQNLGPFSLDQVNTQLVAGHLQPNDLAWWEGQSNWVPLSTVPGVQVPPHAVTRAPYNVPPTSHPPVTPPPTGPTNAKKLTPGKMVLYGVGGLILLGILGPLFSPRTPQTSSPQMSPGTSTPSEASTQGARPNAPTRPQSSGSGDAGTSGRSRTPNGQASASSGGQASADEAARNVEVVNMSGMGKREVGVVDNVAYGILSVKKTATVGEYRPVQADGMFYLLRMRAASNAKETQRPNTMVMKLLDDQGREFDLSEKRYQMLGDPEIGSTLSSFQLQPGTAKEFTLVFDAPANATGLKLKIPSGTFSTSGDTIIKVP